MSFQYRFGKACLPRDKIALPAAATTCHNPVRAREDTDSTMAPNDYDDEIEDEEDEDSVDEEVAATKKRRTAKKWKGT